ncbi:hypothetical protein CEXT_8611, partial [Caerostris extrusa]
DKRNSGRCNERRRAEAARRGKKTSRYRTMTPKKI